MDLGLKGRKVTCEEEVLIVHLCLVVMGIHKPSYLENSIWGNIHLKINRWEEYEFSE